MGEAGRPDAGRSRLFVAVFPPPAVVEALLAWSRSPEAVPPAVRWAPVANLHVTMSFLGHVEEAPVRERFGALAGMLPAAEARVVARPGRLGADALVLPVQGVDALAAAVRAALPPRDPRPFHAHLTLARLRARAACGTLVGSAPAAVGRRWDVTEVALVRSRTDPAGAVYTTVATVAVGSGT